MESNLTWMKNVAGTLKTELEMMMIKILTLTIFGRKVMLFTTTFMMNVSLTAPQKSDLTLANSLEW